MTALQILGGCLRNYDRCFVIRGNIYLLLVGDFGMSKTQLLRYVSESVSRGVYFDSGGLSGNGIFSALYRDVIAGDTVFRTGIFFMLGGGVCCLDQIDLMLCRHRSTLDEVMELQILTVTRSGVVVTLNSRVSLLVFGNLLFCRFLSYLSVYDNVDELLL